MGRYIDWNHVTARYPAVNRRGGSDEVDSYSVVYAEAEVDARLAPSFTVPFSSNNATARDLAVDLTYLRLNPLADADKLAPVQDRVDKMIQALLDGNAAMAVDSGAPIFGTAVGGGRPWSNTMDYPRTFGAGPIEDMHVSSSQLYEEQAERDGDF